MKNAFLLTVLAAVLLVGCNEPEQPVAPAQVTAKAPQETTVDSSGLNQLMKVAECSAVSRISGQVYLLARDGVGLEEISQAVFADLTEADGPVYGMLQSAIKMTADAADAHSLANGDFSAIDMSRIWSGEVFKLCTSDQL